MSTENHPIERQPRAPCNSYHHPLHLSHQVASQADILDVEYKTHEHQILPLQTLVLTLVPIQKMLAQAVCSPRMCYWREQGGDCSLQTLGCFEAQLRSLRNWLRFVDLILDRGQVSCCCWFMFYESLFSDQSSGSSV